VAYRDSHGKTLEDYPRPSVAVDTAVLTVVDGRLNVLLTLTNDAAAGAGDEWRLPGTFLHAGERLADAVRRSLKEKAGITGMRPANSASSTTRSATTAAGSSPSPATTRSGVSGSRPATGSGSCPWTSSRS